MSSFVVEISITFGSSASSGRATLSTLSFMSVSTFRVSTPLKSSTEIELTHIDELVNIWR